MILTRARMLLNKTVFEAEILIEDKYTVYAGILDLGWSLTNKTNKTETADTADTADTTNTADTADTTNDEVAEVAEVAELYDFDFLEEQDYLRIYNAPYEALDSDNEEGQSFRSALPEAERKEIYELCKEWVKEVVENDRTEMKAGEWNNGQWQNFNFSASQLLNSAHQLH